MSVVTATAEVEVARGKRLGRTQTGKSMTVVFFACVHGNAVLEIRLKLAPLNLLRPPTCPLIFYLMLLSIKLLAWPPGASSLRPV